MTDANELDIDAIRARVEAATPGPWQAKAHPTRANSLTVQGDNLFLAHYVHRAENAEFIAHARTDLPAALDEITRLRAALDEATAEAERMTRGSRCPQCSASEWNQASIQRRRAEAAEKERDEALADALREHEDAVREFARAEAAESALASAESALAAVRALHAREKGYGFAADCPDTENHRYAPGYDGDELCLDCPTGEHWWCRTCHDEDGDPVEWPCPTALAYGAEPRRPGLEASSASNEQQSAPFAIPTTVERSESDD